MNYYVYMLYEYPEEKPYYFKIGFTNNPLRRLERLQDGNPRYLRTWDYERRPLTSFGYPLPSRYHAKALEKMMHDKFEEMGMRLRRDRDYQKNHSAKREWFSGLHPKEVDQIMLEMWVKYVDKHKLQDVLDNAE